MPKKLMECTIAVFFVVLSIAVLVGVWTFQECAHEQLALARTQAEAQTELLQSARITRETVLHAGYLFAARTLQAQHVLSDEEADRIAAKSIEVIGGHSAELGTFATAIDKAQQKGR